MSFNSIEKQLDCVRGLMRYIHDVPIHADRINGGVKESINFLRNDGLMEDTLDLYLDTYWKEIDNCQRELENQIEQVDMPYLCDLEDYLMNIPH